ncbi:porin [Persicobacter diffluens]|uniref:Porin n=1 Tax=Persicobacter diffluens TaxID=981 RepID=A0AAN4VYM7_9BACT|nr:hypothetical protein PEDI_17670 [Persicobacter diffluens]
MKAPFTLCLIIFSVCRPLLTFAQDDWQQDYQLSLEAYAEVFYVYDFNRPEGNSRQPFFYNYNRHNEFNLNLGMIRLNLDHSKYRANLAFQAGTYAQDNYAAEQDLLKTVFEANIGMSLNQKNNLWLDVGVLPSHLGFESALGIENPTLSRSLSAENSPYFLTGAKLTFNPTDRLELAGLVVNGWQRIQRLEGNSLPSFGTQVQFAVADRMLLNWSTFIGTDFPDEERRMRYFNNLYGQFQWSEKFMLLSGFDFGFQQQSKGGATYELWWVPTIIGQYRINPKWQSAFRLEYYQDKAGVIIPTDATDGFRTSGFSLNFDYQPNPRLICRLEGRWLQSPNNIFEKASALTNQNVFVGTSLAVKFGEKLR